ncbi:M48 family metalloprotease [Plectonema cf. radiosum LEGE 06105]|uniref:M48 family metalloprotease n=1 Tax=Plectonema cf. radiosum LEGE 06105 TaxID=945769 RepID=A0A8J7EZG8_9CYAN|nr:M48 family metalloprotease [Plectonema radiosum]MBE9211545.1 M48 family metalloprotease [Plectonema cf. radiosum LEGE 06105]
MSILKPAIITCLCLLLSTTTKTEAASENNSIYQNAKIQLPPDFYALYRIVDRIARANEYDTHPWQIVKVAKYDSQAFSQNVNLIPISHGVLEKLGGDASALACIISHEMAHHQQGHQVVRNVEKIELIAQIREDAEKQVLGGERKMSPVSAVGDFVVRRVVGGAIGTVVGGVLNNRSNRRFRQAQQRINTIVEKKTAELEKNIQKQSREDEFVADKFAYLASVKAGFEREGCLRAMLVLNRIPGIEFEQNYPTIEERIAAIKAIMTELETESLVESGQEKLFKTQPLTYNLSPNQTSLRVNSRHGASMGDDIDRMFGN